MPKDVKKHVFSKEWGERHASFLKKWDKDIREKIKNRIIFDWFGGWQVLRVLESSGYCKEFLECSQCLLSSRKACSGKYNPNIIFWKFVGTMRSLRGEVNPSPDWEEAERLCNKMVNLIKKDTPS